VRLNFLTLPERDRRVYVAEAAARRGLSPVLLEKDFWVCWLLGVLFGSRFAGDLVFKGGTSLSKVFGVIDRFSEDIDLSLSPKFLELSDLPAEGSRNQADKWMQKAEAACGVAVRDKIRPELEATVASVLGSRTDPWFEFQIDATTQSPVLLFHYPTEQPAGFDYLKRSVKLEFGSLTEQRLTGRHPIRPWLADALPAAFPDWTCEVVALELERAFWEKATILHAEYHRPAEKPTPDRFSRHYADTAALSLHRDAPAVIAREDLCARVAAWKSQFFGSGWAKYDLAKPGTFRLAPPDARVAALERDYRAMRDMYLSEPAPFEQVLATLAELETRINGKS
jgi:hypothetical protein